MPRKPEPTLDDVIAAVAALSAKVDALATRMDALTSPAPSADPGPILALLREIQAQVMQIKKHAGA